MKPRPTSPSAQSAPSAAAARRVGLAAIAFLGLTGALCLASGRGAAQDSEDFHIGLPAFVQGGDIARPRVQYRDSTISLNDVCAVRHARLDPSRDPVYVNGKPIGFCCTPCPAVFSLNPERYLIPLNLVFQDPVAPRKKAIIDSSRRIMIGQDIYFFSSLATMNRFRKDPVVYCGKITDPVSHVRFRPSKTSPHVVYRSRDYWFAADSTKARFQAEPTRFADRVTGS